MPLHVLNGAFIFPMSAWRTLIYAGNSLSNLLLNSKQPQVLLSKGHIIGKKKTSVVVFLCTLDLGMQRV